MKYSVVIPTYKHLDDCLKPCLESIAKYTNPEDVEIIVVANGCGDDGTKEYVESLGEPFKLLWFDEPIGFIGNGQSSCAHITVAYGFYFFNVVFCDDIIKGFETSMNFGNKFSR